MSWDAHFLQDRRQTQQPARRYEDQSRIGWHDSYDDGEFVIACRYQLGISRSGGALSSLGHEAITSEHVLLAFAEDTRGVCSQVLDEAEARERIVEEAKRLMTDDSYFGNEHKQCLVVGPDENFLGWPEPENGTLWIRKTTGKLVRPEDA